MSDFIWKQQVLLKFLFRMHRAWKSIGNPDMDFFGIAKLFIIDRLLPGRAMTRKAKWIY